MAAKKRKRKLGAKPKKLRKRKSDKCRTALINLLEYAKGNGSSREGNPYFKREVKEAIKALK